MSRRASTVALALAFLVLAACEERPELRTGTKCTLNSDCDTPLVCRLERCRRECAANRDCDVGSVCLFDSNGLGSCRLEPEAACDLNSDCPPPLVCRFGQCTNECATDDDCPAGSRCEPDEDSGGELACVDRSEHECTLDTDCEPPLACAVDGRCREECREDRDCPGGTTCAGPEGQRTCQRPDQDAGA